MKSFCTLVVFLVTVTGFAQLTGHPLITPYPGSTLLDQQSTAFEESTIPVGPVVNGKLSKAERVEGRITRLQYRDPEGRSALEKVRNLEQGLREAGFQIVYVCNNDAEECGSQIAIPSPLKLFPAEKRYLAAKLSRPIGDVWVASTVGAAFTTIWIVEAKPMDQGLVKISADALGKGLLNAGHVAIYGILFDTGKAALKPESGATLKEIATLLQKDPKLKLHVVGHTDNVGPLAANLDLSRQRAAAVVAELGKTHKIPAARLRADGVGPLAPVARNDSDAGRALNRRVELVEQ